MLANTRNITDGKIRGGDMTNKHNNTDGMIRGGEQG